MIVLYFSDSDPSGWYMPLLTAHKVQALMASTFKDDELEFQVHHVGLTPRQVRELGLPSEPIKVTDKRAPKWEAATGTKQTEIDALATLRPELLRTMADDAIKPFYDYPLERRVTAARRQWLADAQTRIEEQDDTDLDELRERASDALELKRDEINAILNEVSIDPDRFDLPDPVVPSEELDHDATPDALCDSRWPLSERIARLQEHKQYLGDDA